MAWGYGTACPKPQRGSLIAQRDQKDADAAKLEKLEKAKVRKRDPRCRFPFPHECRFGLECIHIHDASTGGPMAAENMFRGCGMYHRRGPVSVHGKQVHVVKLTTRGAYGPLLFRVERLDGGFDEWRESAPFAIEAPPCSKSVGPARSRSKAKPKASQNT